MTRTPTNFKPGRHDPHFDFLVPWVYRLFHARRPRDLLHLVQVTPGMRILDVGGGTGRIAQHFPRHVTYVIVDPSRNMLRAAPRQAHWYRVQGRAETLPFAEGTFHRVLVVDALHHFQHQELGLREMWRVLAPGGWLVIEEPDVTHPLGRWLPLFERLLLMRSRFLTAEEMRRALPQARVYHQARKDLRLWLVLEKPHPSPTERRA